MRYKICLTYEELLLFLLSGLVVETTGLNDLVINIKLVPGTSEHGFLDTLLGDETQDTDDLGLTDTMRTILCLQIGVGIPTEIGELRHSRKR